MTESESFWWQLLFMAAALLFTWGAAIAAFFQERGKMQEQIKSVRKASEAQHAEVSERINQLTDEYQKAILEVRSDMRETARTTANDISAIRKAMLDSEGDQKYLTVRRHTDICKHRADSIAKDMTHLKESLDAIKDSVVELHRDRVDIGKLQDAVMLIATRPGDKER